MISNATTEEIAHLVEQQLPLDEVVISKLRNAYPTMHFTYCLDDDITSGKPVLEREAFNVYLIDGREHCLCLTNDHDIATGMVIAEKIEE
ncbi:MAG: hypothetical protein GC149_07540 [Gammaproteobacteria bacterium]|nr:hypothetical protein [Gammaproteobacteria bacterium]